MVHQQSVVHTSSEAPNARIQEALSQPELRQLACLSSPVSGVSSSLIHNSALPLSSSRLCHFSDPHPTSSYSIHYGPLSRNLGPGKLKPFPIPDTRCPSLTEVLAAQERCLRSLRPFISPEHWSQNTYHLASCDWNISRRCQVQRRCRVGH